MRSVDVLESAAGSSPGAATSSPKPFDQVLVTLTKREHIELRTQAKANERQLRDLVLQVAPDLLAMRGVGPVTAAVVIVAWSHRGRVRSEAAFAALARTCRSRSPRATPSATASTAEETEG